MSASSLSKRTRVEGGPLVTAIASIAIAAAMLAGQVQPWPIGLVLACSAYRLAQRRFSLPNPGQVLKFALLALGIYAVHATNGGLSGLGPGLEILFCLVGLKILETSSSRDFQVLSLLGYFLALCDLLFYQDLAHGLAVAFVVFLQTAGLAAFHQRKGWRAALRLAAQLFAPALPLILVLYLFMPRYSAGLRLQFITGHQASSGISDHMEPGAIASLANQHQTVFRASFPDGDVPAELDLYWRGIVLWQCQGLSWERGGGVQREPRRSLLEGKSIHQRIILEPHMGDWLYALDRPSSYVTGATFEPGDCLRSQRPASLQMVYDVFSQPLDAEHKLPENQFTWASHPPKVSPAVRELVASWRKENKDDAKLVRAALDYFRKNRFVYSLSPGTYEKDALDDFLFRRRIGFCEHYAGAFATLMRVAGIPSRVVLGFHGGEFTGMYVDVKQSDAHAWCEVWLKNAGWVRIDPTSAIAPERITAGLESYLESHGAASANSTRGLASMPVLRHFGDAFRLVWENLSYQWDLHVINYDEASQKVTQSVFAKAAELRPDEALLKLVPAVAIAAVIVCLWRRARRRPRDPAAAWYAEYCHTLARHGVRREPWEGPLALAERASKSLPNSAPQIKDAADAYIRTRYGKAAPPLREFASRVKALRKQVRAKHTIPSESERHYL